MSDSRRPFELSLEIGAPVEAVWKALTDAEELVRWFPLEAEVEPRVGGRYFLSWQNEWQGDGRIEIFEPNRHLRTTWPTAVQEQGRPRQLTVDYHLEGRGGRSVLRLVHSGFGPGAEWDDEYDGISVGWNFELRSLRHYLERHQGRNRRTVYLVGPPTGLPAAVLWERVFRDGLGAEPPHALAEGGRYTLPVGGGTVFEGEVLDCRPPKQFAGSIESLGDAIFRVELFGGRVNLWIAQWDGDAVPLAALGNRWREMLRRLFPAAASA